jgi:hypothetical protein
MEQIKAIEEVEPPAWMTRKIMAKVRAETEQKKSTFQRLFYPFFVKLPLQAVAVLFLAVTAFYVYQNIQPSAKYAEAPMPASQKEIAKQEAPPAPAAKREINKADESLLRSKQVPQTPGYKALDMKQEYEAPSSPRLKDQIAASAPASAKPAEQPAPEKKAVMTEKHAAAPRALGKQETQSDNFATGAAPQAKAKREPIDSLKKTEGFADKAEADRRFERVTIEKHSNGTSKLIVTYEVISSRIIKLAEERFTPAGERHGIQKEYYASGQLRAEAQYGYGKLEWYQEYGPDGIKKIGKTNYDWYWLKK